MNKQDTTLLPYSCNRRVPCRRPCGDTQQKIISPHQSSSILLTLPATMLPDYPHKIFGDKRGRYFLLMEALAMDAHPVD